MPRISRDNVERETEEKKLISDSSSHFAMQCKSAVPLGIDCTVLHGVLHNQEQ